jgi:hypothetical protein
VKGEVYVPRKHITPHNLKDRMQTATANVNTLYCRISGKESKISSSSAEGDKRNTY